MVRTLPSLLQHLDEALSVVRGARLGLVVDFDGTVSEIAPTPSAARISDGNAGALRSLVERLTLVSVVSGRQAANLRDLVGLDGVVYVGNHGVEYLAGDRLEIAPEAEGYRDRIREALDHLRSVADGDGLVWQDKQYGASVHYRLAPDPDEARGRLATALTSTPGVDDLDVFWGKLVLELRPPVGLDKGLAVKRLAADRKLDGVIFIGDDTTDVDGLLGLRDLGSDGRVGTLGVAVLHKDSPAELIDAADYSLDGVAGVESFLRWLDSAVPPLSLPLRGGEE